MNIFYYISISVFALYTLFILLKIGVPKSISDSVSSLGEEKLISSLFTWFCFFVAIPLLPYWIDYSGDDMRTSRKGIELIKATEATYDQFVSGLIRSRYSADQVEAILLD